MEQGRDRTAEVYRRLERIKEMWRELERMRPETRKYKAMVERIHAESREYVKLVDDHKAGNNASDHQEPDPEPEDRS